MKVGLFVDTCNVSKTGGFGMQYDVLRQFAQTDGFDTCSPDISLTRLNAYLFVDRERLESTEDEHGAYLKGVYEFRDRLQELGYHTDLSHQRLYGRDYQIGHNTKMAVDIVEAARHLDRIIVVTSDHSLHYAVQVARQHGCQVHLLSFQNPDTDLVQSVDLFTSAYLLPDLLPVRYNRDHNLDYGSLGSRIRGICYAYNDIKKFGFVRWIPALASNTWITDARSEQSPYKTAFFHCSQIDCDTNKLPSRSIVLEGELLDGSEGYKLEDIQVVNQ